MTEKDFHMRQPEITIIIIIIHNKYKEEEYAYRWRDMSERGNKTSLYRALFENILLASIGLLCFQCSTVLKSLLCIGFHAELEQASRL